MYKLLEKPPVNKKQDNEAQRRKRPVLLQQQLPVDPHRGTTILLAIVPQATTNLAHPLQAIPAIQQILDILRHDLCHIPQLIVQLVEVLAGARIGIGGLGLGDEVVKLHKGVGPQGRVVDLGRRVGGGELAGQVREVCEGELARVRGGADAEEDDVRLDEVVQRVRAAVDAGLGLGVARELAEDLAHVLLGFGEVGLGLLVVDRGAEHEALGGG